MIKQISAILGVAIAAAGITLMPLGEMQGGVT
ncbi:MAG: hypothetical protein RL612_606, partial [Actinomycetota bacterium]